MKRRRSEEIPEPEQSTPNPTSLLIQFQAMSSDASNGPTLDVPYGVSRKELELLINSILSSKEPAPYSFYLNDQEVLDSLSNLVKEQNLSPESIHVVKYQPLAVFKVMPVSRCTDTLSGHTDSVLHVSFSPDGKYLASGGGDALVRFWDTSSCLPRQVAQGHVHHVLCTSWSPDGKYFASADKSGLVLVWDPVTGKQVHQPLRGHSSWVTSLSWEPLHARRIGNTSGSNSDIPGDDSHVELLLASSSKDKSVRVWNIRTGLAQVVLTGHTDSIEAVKWGGQNLLYTASRDRSIIVWALDEAKQRAKHVRTLLGHGHRINALALNTDILLRTGIYDHTKASSSLYKKPYNEIVELARKRYEATLASMGGKELLVSASDDFTLFLWDPSDSKKSVVRLVGHQQPVTTISFSPDGRYLASGSFDKKVKLWDGKTGKFLCNFNGHVGAVYQVCWSSDSRYVVSASKDSTVKVWPAPRTAAIAASNTLESKGDATPAVKATAISTLSGHLDEVYALDWSPNGAMLASGSKDRLVKIWRH
jgi:ribosome assembly protein 4